MFDLTGNNLAGYIIRVIRDVVARNPRFRQSLGDVSLTSNNQVSYQDVQCVIKDVTAQGTRQSFDYFLCTQMGRTLIARVADKEGAFFEWADEIDPTGILPVAGVYMFNVDSVDEQTRQVGFTIETYLWFEGYTKSATGSAIYFRPGLDGTTVTPFDTTTLTIVPYQAAENSIYLLGPVAALGIQARDGSWLVPVTDYWALQSAEQVVLNPTIFGTQTAAIPAGYGSVQLLDQDGFTLRPGIDYQYVTPQQVVLSGWTPAGAVITATGMIEIDPSQPGAALHGENILDIQLPPGATLAADQVWVATNVEDNAPVTLTPAGAVALVNPLPPGGWLRYDLRALVGQTTATGWKMASNVNLIPGLRIAIGDQVVVGDQCALLISPHVTETYRVYGAKDNVSFSIDVKANDPATSSDLAELLKRELLVNRRTVIEADGLTILEASRSTVANQRDRSATAASWVTTLALTALADWRVFEPLVNRITSFDITAVANSAYPRMFTPEARYTELRTVGFLPSYS